MKSILMTTEMLKAVIDLRKIQTRRLDGLQEINKNPDNFEYSHIYNGKYMFLTKDNIGLVPVRSKYKIGDIVGIKENFCIAWYNKKDHIVSGGYLPSMELFSQIQLTEKEWNKFSKWKNMVGDKSKLFMFDSFIRYKIQITDIRVERVRDITVDDCIKEGVKSVDGYDFEINEKHIGYFEHPNKTIAIFYRLWDSINKKRGYGWVVNPWVWVVEFKQTEGINAINAY